jgi:hypothetical protein
VPDAVGVDPYRPGGVGVPVDVTEM